MRYDLDLHVDHADRATPYVPAILTVPDRRPAAAALLLHGFGSRKERMSDTIGTALLRHDMAALAVDLPMHGARGESGADLRTTNPLKLVGLWRDAVREAEVALEYLAQHPELDARRIGIVGYSLGSFLASIVASASPSVGAVVLAAGGDLPSGLPFESLVRGVVNPLKAVRGLAGKPLLMINGRYDRTVTPVQAERLFAAALEPKTLRWYSGGHWPPEREVEFAARWLADNLAKRGSSEPQRRRDSERNRTRTRSAT